MGLDAAGARQAAGQAAGAGAAAQTGPGSRGLHSSTFQLNVSALCAIGGAFKGC